MECGLCGKEGAPQCSQCCISCSEASGCTAPSVTGCLDKCCPNKKVCLREREKGWLYQYKNVQQNRFCRKVVDFKSDRRETEVKVIDFSCITWCGERERVYNIMERKSERAASYTNNFNIFL